MKIQSLHMSTDQDVGKASGAWWGWGLGVAPLWLLKFAPPCPGVIWGGWDRDQFIRGVGAPFCRQLAELMVLCWNNGIPVGKKNISIRKATNNMHIFHYFLLTYPLLKPSIFSSQPPPLLKFLDSSSINPCLKNPVIVILIWKRKYSYKFELENFRSTVANES